ncbi:MAG: hypothetical protein ACK5OB_18325 [Pirellula sp.]
MTGDPIHIQDGIVAHLGKVSSSVPKKSQVSQGVERGVCLFFESKRKVLEGFKLGCGSIFCCRCEDIRFSRGLASGGSIGMVALAYKPMHSGYGMESAVAWGPMHWVAALGLSMATPGTA